MSYPSPDFRLQQLHAKTIDELLTEYLRGEVLGSAHPVTDAIIKVKLHHQMSELTKEVRKEVATLRSSSDRVETLTKKLNRFTIWLLIFAGIQIVVAVIQTWRMFQPEQPVRVVVQPPPLTAPQTPSPPPH